jgi:hypothetical protein
MADRKYSIFQIQGGLGKHIAATAVAQAIKNNHPDRELIVVCAWPELWANLPFVYRVFPLGNTRGWAQEWERWFARILLLASSSYFAAALVDLPAGGPAVLTSASNIASAVRLSLGVVAITFTNPATSTNYVVLPSAEGQGGMFLVRNKTVNGFVIERSDLGGSLVDDDFGVVVEAM